MMTANRQTTQTRPQLTTSIEAVRGGPTRVSVGGELDIATAGAFRDLLTELLVTGRPSIAIDASDLHFCDSQGLSALVAAANLAEALGGRITVENPREPVAKVLRITGLDRRFATVAATA